MGTEHRILVLFAHPALEKSRVNAVLVDGARDLAGVTFRDLYEAYPDFDIDVRAEQKLLEPSDIVVFQHPFYWYSAPSLLKEWQDLVLEHGWAYGKTGNALRGKALLSAITTGGGASAYEEGGSDRFTMKELLAPFAQMARLCGMDYLPPFVVHGTHALADADIEGQAAAYRRMLEALREGRIDLDTAREHPRINFDLDAVIRD